MLILQERQEDLTVSSLFELRDVLEDKTKWIKTKDLNFIDISRLKSLGGLFSSWAFGFNYYGDISEWDTSRIEYMGNLFRKSKFNNKIGNIGNWDVSRVKDFTGMFKECSTVDTFDLSNWKIQKGALIFQAFSNLPRNKRPKGLENYEYGDLYYTGPREPHEGSWGDFNNEDYGEYMKLANKYASVYDVYKAR